MLSIGRIIYTRFEYAVENEDSKETVNLQTFLHGTANLHVLVVVIKSNILIYIAAN